MQILITGATGFIGSAFIQKFLDKYQFTALVRQPKQARQKLPAPVKLLASLDELQNLDQFDAVINLAGEPIFAKAWTAKQKQKLSQSRLQITAQLSQLINQSHKPPSCFISASATGYYGDQGEHILYENSKAGSNFCAQLCQQWEQQALKANTRLCLLRTGLVLSPAGGVLAKMLPLYRFGLGGKLGKGTQYWPWISLRDMLNAIDFLLQNPQCQGAFNLCAPNPVPNQQFSQLISQALKRPHFCHQPAWLLKYLLGERASLLLDSQNAQPQALLAQGFQFQDPSLETALPAILQQK